MLKQQQQLFRSVLLAADTVIIAGATVVAYLLRFHLLVPWIPVRGDATWAFTSHAIPFLVVTPPMLLAMLWSGLYQPRRDQRFFAEAAGIVKAVVIGMGLTIAVLSLFRNVLFEQRHYSGWQFGIYVCVVTVMLLLWRFGFRIFLRWVRARGWNLRHVAIIGCGRLGQVVERTLERNSWTGIKPNYFVSHHGHTTRKRCVGLPVYGGLDDLERTLDKHEVSGVFIALPNRLASRLPDLLNRLERYSVDVRVVPDMNPRFTPINMDAHELDGMPVLSVRQSPMAGWGQVSKRMLDITGSLTALAIFALPMAIIAIAVRLSGPGPVIFRQKRMSINGRCFDIFKFRTMHHADAERLVGRGTEAWTKRDDARVTGVGRILRRTSLDELPQLFNVLLGEMSLVGPRPESMELIEHFREDWRGYMLRQNVKAGITGWAQVNGLRGDTSLRKRLQYDLFYIRNWSLGFDLRILWLTIFKGFAHPNAH